METEPEPNGLAELESLESFFASAKLPESVWLDKASEVTDVPKFIESHIETARHGIGKRYAIPYLERLEMLKEKIEGNTKQ